MVYRKQQSACLAFLLGTHQNMGNQLWALGWCRGEMSDETKRHETIHFQQQLELLFVGQWILYGLFWLIGLIRYRDGKKAYYENPFEREAYRHDKEEGYLATRPRYAWSFYVFE